jgi:hypothetical protein
MKSLRCRVGLAISTPLLLAAVSADVTGGSDSPAPTPAQAPCAAPEYRQFDFWVGNWDVMEEGKLAGTNQIDSTLGGCVVHENWKGAKGMVGTSLNVYDAPAGKWRQSWADSNGSVLLLEGEFRDGKMVLEGSRPGKGGVVRHRISWQRIGGDPNRVQQLWEVSKDGGKSWSAVFDGTYVRTGAGRLPPG